MQQRPFFFEGDLIDLIRVPLQAQFSELLRLVRDGFVDPLLYFILAIAHANTLRLGRELTP